MTEKTLPVGRNNRDTALDYAIAFEIAAKFVERFETAEEAAGALEYEAIKLRRKWSTYPVAAPGEREYRSWRFCTNGESERTTIGASAK